MATHLGCSKKVSYLRGAVLCSKIAVNMLAIAQLLTSCWWRQAGFRGVTIRLWAGDSAYDCEIKVNLYPLMPRVCREPSPLSRY